MLNGLLISFLISLNTIVLIRERNSGSKSLQLLHGTHFAIYWLANYIFDLLVYFISILSILITLQIVSSFDEQNDAYLLLGSRGENFIYMLIFLAFSSLSWPVFAYIWSFLFKRDIVGFVVLFLVLSCAIFLDMIMVILQLVFLNSEVYKSWKTFADVSRTLLALFFPGVTTKKAFYNLKKQSLPECLKNDRILCNIFNIKDFSFTRLQ